MKPNTNAVGQPRQFWAVLPILAAEELAATAQLYEQLGFEGVFAPQVYGPPFIPLAAASTVTKTLKLGTGIAIAATRSPMETAMAAIDLDRISQGRLLLGLGSSISSWSNGIYGTGDIKPISHLRDTIKAIRHIEAGAHRDIKPYNGEYFKADFEAMIQQNPPFRKHIPIIIGALREKMICLAAEIADGVTGHPMWSIDWTLNSMMPAFERELKVRGRKREDLLVSVWPWVAINDDKQQAINDARSTVAYYASAVQYESFFEAHGYLGEARECQAGVQRNRDISSFKDQVSDAMVETFVTAGPADEVRDRLEPLWGVCDHMCPTPPLWNLAPETVQEYSEKIGLYVSEQVSR